MSLALYNEFNIANSFATYLAGKVLEADYLIYWHETDMLQTSTQILANYSQTQETHLADLGFAAEVAAAKGLLTICDDLAAIPRFTTRLTNDGRVGGRDVVHVPAVSISIGPTVTLSPLEIGSLRKWRVRRLTIEGATRDEAEQESLLDLLGIWCDEDTTLAISNHSNSSLDSVGNVIVRRPSSQAATIPTGAEAVTFQVLLNARLEYVA